MPEYVVTTPNGWAGWRISAACPHEAAAIAAKRDLHALEPPAIEEAPAPWPAEWVVIDVSGDRIRQAMPVQAHRFRRKVKP